MRAYLKEMGASYTRLVERAAAAAAAARWTRVEKSQIELLRDLLGEEPGEEEIRRLFVIVLRQVSRGYMSREFGHSVLDSIDIVVGKFSKNYGTLNEVAWKKIGSVVSEYVRLIKWLYEAFGQFSRDEVNAIYESEGREVWSCLREVEPE